jgi:hypothetical protein
MTAAVLAALQSALAAEHSASYGYGVVGAHLPVGSAALASAGADWIAHQRARDELTAMISNRGGQPAAAAVAYSLPFPVTSAATAAQLGATIEDRVAQAYLALVALREPALRMFGAEQVRECALRAESWRGSTEAFPGLPPASLRR